MVLEDYENCGRGGGGVLKVMKKQSDCWKGVLDVVNRYFVLLKTLEKSSCYEE